MKQDIRIIVMSVDRLGVDLWLAETGKVERLSWALFRLRTMHGGDARRLFDRAVDTVRGDVVELVAQEVDEARLPPRVTHEDVARTAEMVADAEGIAARLAAMKAKLGMGARGDSLRPGERRRGGIWLYNGEADEPEHPETRAHAFPELVDTVEGRPSLDLYARALCGARGVPDLACWVRWTMRDVGAIRMCRACQRRLRLLVPDHRAPAI